VQRLTFLTTAFAAITVPAPGDPQFAALERRAGGRIGVYALDTGNGRSVTYRAHERFPMCSTFKLLLAGTVLARVDARNEDLARVVGYGDRDMVAGSPVATAHLRLASMTIAELCAAAIEQSDNTAANLLLHSVLGPAGVTKFARKIGDSITRLDRNEPDVNTAIPGDPRDTTTPAAIAEDARKLLFGNVLSPRMRARLRTWLLASRTGKARLRAGFPPSWQAGDKTGTGSNGTANDVAIVWPPRRSPIVVAAYLTASAVAPAAQNAVLADAGRIVYQRLR
jgi:beta-lactamase class A